MKEKVYNLATYFLLPLIDYSLTLKDYENAGFVNLYTADINRPYLNDNRVFLMFRSCEFYSTTIRQKIVNNANFYNNYTLKINNEWYCVYTFFIPREHSYEISRLEESPEIIKYDTKLRILSFWSFGIDNNMHRALFVGCKPLKIFCQEIPEEDIYFKDPIAKQIFEEEIALV